MLQRRRLIILAGIFFCDLNHSRLIIFAQCNLRVLEYAASIPLPDFYMHFPELLFCDLAWRVHQKILRA